MFKIRLEDSCLVRVRACADEIGLAMSKLMHLPIVQTISADVACVCGLQLKAVRCFVILEAVYAFPSNCAALREWLNINGPGWENMVVSSSAAYLGILFGALSGKVQWTRASKKFQDRFNSIRSLHLLPALAEGNFSVGPCPP